jgi:UDP-N-acetylmuramoyl-L-alanyl-D-glutamate--2,6-diaminopimelate ligase
MEVSSHALSQDRISGISFDRAVFTNLTHDHLDYHNTMEEYFISKRRLFTEYLSGEGLAIINMDSEYGVRLKSELGVRSLGFTRKCLSQAEKGSDVTLESADMVMGETKLTISYRGNIYRFQTNLWGDINIENLLATVTLGLSMGFSETVISRALANVYVQGRCESIKLPVGAMAVIDYAHTPDALERIIKSLRGLVEGRLVCLFGCGGDRDKDKRPKMGKIAAENADETLITSDNPRSERPEDIIEDILKGIIIKDNVRAIADRRDAIYTALNSLTKGDCLLIAGKGHEDYQIIGDKKSHFSDQEEVEAWMHSQRADLNEAGNGH